MMKLPCFVLKEKEIRKYASSSPVFVERHIHLESKQARRAKGSHFPGKGI